MTNALEDLVTSLQIFSDILENENVDLEEFDYIEFLTDTIPALGDRIEREALTSAYLRTMELDPNNTTKLRSWYENEMGLSATSAVVLDELFEEGEQDNG